MCILNEAHVINLEKDPHRHHHKHACPTTSNTNSQKHLVERLWFCKDSLVSPIARFTQAVYAQQLYLSRENGIIEDEQALNRLFKLVPRLR